MRTRFHEISPASVLTYYESESKAEAAMDRVWQSWTSIWSGRPKVFGIGMGKTGTTSLERAFVDFGYRIGPQPKFERHFDEWFRGDNGKLLADIRRFEAFQDVPFCLPGTYRLLFEHFPRAKYVLTVRDSSEQWYNSPLSFEVVWQEWSIADRRRLGSRDLHLAGLGLSGVASLRHSSRTAVSPRDVDEGL
jgi:hypothetical protein